MKSQRGFTLIELLTAVATLVVFSVWGLALYVAWHFISKIW